MNTEQLSSEQLVDLVKSIDGVEVRSTLKEEFNLSADGLEELLKRIAAFKEGKISSRPWNDIKQDFGSIQNSFS